MKRKKVRIKDIAKRLGISPATVSLALNNPNKVNRSTRKDILTLCEQLNYTRPQKLKNRKKQIAVLIGYTYNFTNDFFSKIAESLLDLAKEHEYNLILESWPNEQDDIPWCLSHKNIDGVIVIGKILREKLLWIKQKGLPLVVCSHTLHDMALHTVLPDGKSGSYQATKHLIELGHTKIATITGGDFYREVAMERIEGYRFALIEAGIKVREDYIALGDFAKYDHSDKPLKKLLALKNPPTAIVCASDSIAYNVIRTLNSQGIKVPEEISITGFDNTPPPLYAQAWLPKLTSVNVDTQELAKYSLKVLFDLMEENPKVSLRYTLPVKLHIGETTGKPKD